MKIKNLICLTTLVSLALSSCADGGDNVATNNNAIKFNASIASTRATGTSWTAGDKIGIFMIPQGKTLGDALASNKRYTASASGELTNDGDDQALYYPSDGSNVDFVTYYPYTNVTNNQIPVNVADQSSQASIDLLYTKTSSGFSNSSTSVPLNYKHKLAHMILNITKSADVSLSNFAVNLVGTKTKATFDLATDTLIAAGDAANVTYKLTDNGNNQMQAEAIILPNNNLTTDAAIEFTIGTQTFKQSLSGDTLKSGSNYNYTVNISNKNGQPVVAVGQATITDWIQVPGSDINVDMGGTTTPTDPTTQNGDTIFSENFGTTVQKDANNYWPAINQYTGWQNSTLSFTDSYLGSNTISTASVRQTTTMNCHVWFAATKDASLKISGFNTSGYTSLKLYYDIAANGTGDQNVIGVKCGDTDMDVPSKAIPKANIYQTVELDNLPLNITSVEFTSLGSKNSVGYRIDNVKLVGVK